MRPAAVGPAVISTSQPGTVARSSTQMSAVAATDERKPPHRKYQPKMFENQVGFSAITWSNAIIVCPNAYQRAMIGASTRRRAREALHSAASPRQPAVQLVNIPFARVARSAGALRHALGVGLEALARIGGHHDLGFSSMEAYALERCERSARRPGG